MIEMSDLSGNIYIEGPVGRLEALLKEPEGAVTRVAIVCHPHPLFGGTMHNKVVYRIAKEFQNAGFAVLRFNIRGAGRSEGEHSGGPGEQDDLRAAINFVERRYSGAEVWVSGFSFGASVMLRTSCDDPRIQAVIAVGLPASRHDFSLVGGCKKMKLFVQGSHDEFGSPSDLERLVNGLDEPKRLVVIEQAGHFFDGQLDELARAVSEFINASEFTNK